MQTNKASHFPRSSLAESMRDSPEGKRYVVLLEGGPLARVAAFRFTEDERAAITRLLSRRLSLPAESSRIQSFLGGAERAAAAFKLLEQLERQKPKPRVVRDTAATIRRQISALRKSVEEMAPPYRELLLLCLQHPMFHGGEAVVIEGGKLPTNSLGEIEAAVLARILTERSRRELADDFVDRFSQELIVWDAASQMATTILDRPEHKPKPGPKAASWRVQFAADIAWVFWLRLDVEPTATQAGDAAKEESVFESVLRICFCAVGVDIRYVHRSASAAMKKIKVQKKSKQ